MPSGRRCKQRNTNRHRETSATKPSPHYPRPCCRTARVSDETDPKRRQNVVCPSRRPAEAAQTGVGLRIIRQRESGKRRLEAWALEYGKGKPRRAPRCLCYSDARLQRAFRPRAEPTLLEAKGRPSRSCLPPNTYTARGALAYPRTSSRQQISAGRLLGIRPPCTTTCSTPPLPSESDLFPDVHSPSIYPPSPCTCYTHLID